MAFNLNFLALKKFTLPSLKQFAPVFHENRWLSVVLQWERSPTTVGIPTEDYRNETNPHDISIIVAAGNPFATQPSKKFSTE